MRRPFPTHRLRTTAACWHGRRRHDSAAFVQVLIAPYRRRDGARRRLSLTMLIRRAAMRTTIVERHLHVAAIQRWRVQLVVNRLTAADAKPSLRAVAPAAGGVDRPRPAPLVAAPALVMWNALPARLIARATRVDAASPPAGTPPAVRAGANVGADTRIGRRDDGRLPVVSPAAAVAIANALRPVANPAAPAVTTSEGRIGTMVPPRPVGSPVLDHGELQRLATRVIGSIDDRIAAARERLGSV